VVVLVVDSVPAAAHALRHPATGARQRRRRGDGGEGRGAAARGRRERREFRSPRLASPRHALFLAAVGRYLCVGPLPAPSVLLPLLVTNRPGFIWDLFGVFFPGSFVLA
jgi:hypothetical protein